MATAGTNVGDARVQVVAVAKAEQQAQAAAKGAEPWALCSSCLTTQLSRSMPLSNLSYRLDESRSVAVRGKL